ncbi:RP-LP2 [Mytilus coruscus]|uniref:RP-LP2 n=1 Tax=Mytilus coruscus TaxID=42192 RepID=A0A6J8BDM3_MYTCO|nr:RP-LP2 [Mytilus coruscus]
MFASLSALKFRIRNTSEEISNVWNHPRPIQWYHASLLPRNQSSSFQPFYLNEEEVVHSFVSERLKKCVTWQLTYLHPLEETQILQPVTLKRLLGKNLEDLIKEGQEKLASVPSGGAVAAAPAAAAEEAPKGGAKKEEKKKPEPESESDDDMGFGLFD